MSEWQKISTAPKDGTEVLVWCCDCALVPLAMNFFSRAYFQKEHDDPEYMEAGWYLSYSYPGNMPECTWKPTHWVPIPKPPGRRKAVER